MDSSVNQTIDLDVEEDIVEKPTVDKDITNETTATEESNLAKRKRGKSSDKETWVHYVRYQDPKTNKWRARCKHCNIVSYAIGNGTSSHGTTNLNKHIFEGGCVALRNKNPCEVMETYSKNLKKTKISQEVFRERMGMEIIKHNYPFSMVEHTGLRDVFDYLNPDVKNYTRNTAKADCLKIYAKEKERIKLLLAKAPGRISLTSDVWSSLTSEGYLSLTAHFVDENWLLHSYILNFCYIPPPHNGFLMSEKILEFLKNWEIDKKIFTLTLDNASSNDNMQDRLKVQMRNNLLCGGIFFHIRCSAHILNLIVQDGLKIAVDALYKIRESVKYVKGSDARRVKFGNCCRTCGVSCESGLRLDVTVRWNSTWKMLENALKYRDVFSQFAIVEPGYKTVPTVEEWKRAERIAIFLEPFNEITTIMSGSKYPTANLYMMCVWKIHVRLLEALESDDLVISTMAKEMVPKFDKYWESYSLVLSMAMVLDPRYKLDFVKFIYRRIETVLNNLSLDVKLHIGVSGYREGWEVKAGEVEKQFKKLYKEYESKFNGHVPQEILVTDVGSSCTPYSSTTTCLRDETIDFDLEDNQNTLKSELDIYLDERKLDRREHAHLDILEYWKDNSCASRYPILGMMARDLLSVPITTVASESAFSIGAKVITKYRSSLLPDIAQALICARTWLCGYKVQSDEPGDEQLFVHIPDDMQPTSTTTMFE